MKKIYAIGALFLLSACTKNFSEINTDPNTATTVNPQYLLTTALVKTAYPYQDDAFLDKPAEAARYITKVRNEGDDLFGWAGINWDGYYGALTYNKTFHDLAASKGMLQYTAISDIIKVFNFAYITDLYGDIPYSEALLSKDSSIVHPGYDRQEDIYPSLLATLTAANDTLASNAQTIDADYDILYGGVALNWRKFANALHLRLLLRMAKKSATAYTEMQNMLNDPAKYPLFESNNDDAALKYLGVNAIDSWPGGNLNSKATEIDKYKPAKEIVDTLLRLHDPRLPVWAAPVSVTAGYTVDANLYVGVPNAIASPYDYNGGETHISKMAPIFYANQNNLLKASMMSYAEQCFILAEVMQQGKVTVNDETAASLYIKGISASLDAYGISASAKATYLAQAAVQYNGTLVQLITQKWIANFLKGPEGWFDQRRTGYPVFVTGPLAAISEIPSRYKYPTTEQSYNLDEYNAAVTRQGTDALTTKMWYLK
ncbi:SusD/RagB family nutrient-binding outer membrane lipoprotein [Chitinophaga sancti]|uniref:Starch-binding associating with outer membrane n=1 Tax=Chitinophaga sancti TaxID=1004 RepID=A0A1K1RQL1_9BACT|nr:SusD/RagB family nutrient-binding outer membrane lipoprotein [Chitinophaga sancti]WQD62547.1 SusD/RagB family nutrient-binding outer membrane lipoprotein [Chitinophaga sancti]WQG91884.1 SusD/RagB family nutrient-binding outer membrane lipoprotein [Chitinophaga sancti]SFW74007.1 Starch-binding associating with outer membrane [Chitinophaga sancti]